MSGFPGGARGKRLAILHPDMAAGGGAENYIHWISEELVRQGHAVTVFSGRFSQAACPYERIQVDLGLKAMRWRQSTRRLAEELPRFDGIILHNFPSALHFGFVHRKLGGRLPPSLWFCQEPKVSLYGVDEAQRRRLARRRLRRFSVADWNTIRLDRSGVRAVGAIRGNSRRTARFAASVYGRPVEALHLAIPDATVAENPVGEKGDFFLFTGRLFAVKNVYGALGAFEEFVRLTGDRRLRLVFAGEGPEREGLLRRAAEAGLGERVEAKGWIDDAGLRSLMDRAVAVLNVPHREPFGLVTLETWARRTALILAGDGGSAELATDGENALLVDPADVGQIAAAMARLAGDPGLGERLAANGYGLVREKYLMSHHVRHLLSALGV
ncbi:MAG: glycosyltransferase family 4 protein [Spirochaetes bacterium]|nr:glycosyltransferase family 4 protein [Spirochaetota bacterium]